MDFLIAFIKKSLAAQPDKAMGQGYGQFALVISLIQFYP